MLASRKPQGPDPFLDLRIGLFVIGGILGIIGMYIRVPVVISFGILALAIGMILRFVGKARHARGSAPAADDEDGTTD